MRRVLNLVLFVLVMFSFVFSVCAVESIEWTDALREEYLQKYIDGEWTLDDIMPLMHQDDELASMVINWMANNSEGGLDITSSEMYADNNSSNRVRQFVFYIKLLISCMFAVIILASLLLYVRLKHRVLKYVCVVFSVLFVLFLVMAIFCF